MLSIEISQKTCQTGYRRFRPNNSGYHLWGTCYRGGWHVSCPPLIRQTVWVWQKPDNWHLESPYHTFVHCKGFATAAPRRARVLVSVPFSGLPLTRPVRIKGLVGSYPANNLIRRRLISRRSSEECFRNRVLPDLYAYPPLAPVSRDWEVREVDYPRVTEPCAKLSEENFRLACLNRTPIAVSASRISWNCARIIWN